MKDLNNKIFIAMMFTYGCTSAWLSYVVLLEPGESNIKAFKRVKNMIKSGGLGESDQDILRCCKYHGGMTSVLPDWWNDVGFNPRPVGREEEQEIRKHEKSVDEVSLWKEEHTP